MVGNTLDADARVYIAAVEAADGNALELGVKLAYDKFIRGIKADASVATMAAHPIKAACILAGARSLAGALVPLIGPAPTNAGGLFGAGDYNRETGLIGDGASKYLNANRANNEDPQNSNHNAAWITATGATTAARIMGGNSSTYATGDNVFGWASGQLFIRSRSSAGAAGLGAAATGLVGVSRNSSNEFTYRRGGSSSNVSQASQSPSVSNVLIFAGGNGDAALSNARVAYYCIGESLDLALLDARLATLMSDLATAIP
jgi:hypothetical protein